LINTKHSLVSVRRKPLPQEMLKDQYFESVFNPHIGTKQIAVSTEPDIFSLLEQFKRHFEKQEKKITKNLKKSDRSHPLIRHNIDTAGTMNLESIPEDQFQTTKNKEIAGLKRSGREHSKSNLSERKSIGLQSVCNKSSEGINLNLKHNSTPHQPNQKANKRKIRNRLVMLDKISSSVKDHSPHSDSSIK